MIPRYGWLWQWWPHHRRLRVQVVVATTTYTRNLRSQPWTPVAGDHGEQIQALADARMGGQDALRIRLRSTI